MKRLTSCADLTRKHPRRAEGKRTPDERVADRPPRYQLWRGDEAELEEQMQREDNDRDSHGDRFFSGPLRGKYQHQLPNGDHECRDHPGGLVRKCCAQKEEQISKRQRPRGRDPVVQGPALGCETPVTTHHTGEDRTEDEVDGVHDLWVVHAAGGTVPQGGSTGAWGDPEYIGSSSGPRQRPARLALRSPNTPRALSSTGCASMEFWTVSTSHILEDHLSSFNATHPAAPTPKPMPRDTPTGADEARVLLIDDDESVGRMLAGRLENSGHRVTLLTDGEAALAEYTELAPDVVVVDLWMPKLNGMQILADLQQRDPATSVILLSGNIDVPTTVRALRAGAIDVQTKPVDIDLLRAAIDRGIERSRLIRTNRVASTQIADPYGVLDDSPPMRRLLRMVENLAGSPVPVFIVGEAGTGKRIIAEMLHQLSSRSSHSFVRIMRRENRTRVLQHAFNGISLDPSVLGEPALLGSAKGGTIFVDEVAELSLVEQHQLLALLTRVTGSESTSVRIIAATERDLAEDARTGRILGELYRRLAVLPLSVPSLRSRGQSAIRTLATRMVGAQRCSLGRGPLHIADSAMSLLISLEWPGNVSQLRSVLEEAFFVALESEELTITHLRGVIDRSGMTQPDDAMTPDDQTLECVERRHIAHVLMLTSGHRTEAARILGITRTTLYKKMYEYGLDKVGNE